MQDSDPKLTEQIDGRGMIEVGEWELVKVVTDEFSSVNPTVATERHVEKLDSFEGHRGLWRHSDGKTYLKVFTNSQGNYDAVVYMGSHDTDSVGPGWTCGVDCRNTDAQTAVQWAHEYMTEHSDVSHLYD